MLAGDWCKAACVLVLCPPGMPKLLHTHTPNECCGAREAALSYTVEVPVQEVPEDPSTAWPRGWSWCVRQALACGQGWPLRMACSWLTPDLQAAKGAADRDAGMQAGRPGSAIVRSGVGRCLAGKAAQSGNGRLPCHSLTFWLCRHSVSQLPARFRDPAWQPKFPLCQFLSTISSALYKCD